MNIDKINRVSRLWQKGILCKEIAKHENMTEGSLKVWVVQARKSYPDLFPKRPPGGINRNLSLRSPKRESLKPVISSLLLQGCPIKDIAKEVNLQPEHIRLIAYIERKRGNNAMFPKLVGSNQPRYITNE